MSKEEDRLAAVFGVNPITVRRVLRHERSVEKTLRQKILTYAGENGIPSGTCAAGTPDAPLVYIMLPDTPTFFWKEIGRGIRETFRYEKEHRGLSAVLSENYVSTMSDTVSMSLYIEEAIRKRASVILCAAENSEKIREQLTAFAGQSDTLLIFVSEKCDIADSCYVGADNYMDGFLLARKYCSRPDTAGREIHCFRNPWLTSLDPRIEGFCDALFAFGREQYAMLRFHELELDFFTPHSAVSAHYAALFHKIRAEEAEAGKPLAFYVPFGSSGDLSAAARKARLDDILFLTHDIAVDPQNGDFITINQDTYLQGSIAMRYAMRFLSDGTRPADRRRCIPSRIF